jgi:hypothetical protein
MNVHLHGAGAGRKPRSAATIYFYTQCRNWHGYLSAFAFLMLMFFSATGILLNHPDWLVGAESEPQTARAQIQAADIAAARASTDPAAALGALAAHQMALLGVYASGDVDSREALLRFEGVKGMSTVTLDLRTGEAQARLQKADAVTMLNDLHRGKNVGAAWAAIIDISGVLILILSLIGYILFFSMRFRFRTAMILTAVSVIGLAGVFVFLVP